MPGNDREEKITLVSALILAGGKSRRMGRQKGSLPLGGLSLLERALAKADRVFAQVYLSGPPELGRLGRPVISDEIPELGPIGGILTGLQKITTPWLFALPCDSPFVPEQFLRGMASLINDHDVVVPRWEGYYEPLQALYSKRCLPALSELVAAGERKIVTLYPWVRVKEAPEELLREWDPQGLAFLNINTPEDLARAEEYLANSG